METLRKYALIASAIIRDSLRSSALSAPTKPRLRPLKVMKLEIQAPQWLQPARSCSGTTAVENAEYMSRNGD
ncbi:hypothetical protein Q7C36_008878 [Tachysurus vachellii]|uniref:Uncharacterized protein n=1 Tax=Tachysurus vachellii TaxID=175792 RepID=A0AA88SU35_TACVA|nr:hypothetical protein Q7C36_008878 [Tachysurus vachellii]